MIKTMLLTAQLALSPIVGTNGLQPKRLPNPVYGETTDYSVSYEGENYTRLAYVDKETKWLVEWNEKTQVSFNFKGIQTNGEAWLYSNIGTGEGEDYLIYYWAENNPPYTDDMSGNVCVAFYTFLYDGDTEVTTYYYYEVFANEDWEVKANVYQLNNQNIWEYLTQEEMEQDHIGPKLKNSPFSNVPLCTIGNIPQYQPTIANLSIYDNIYNFYYQNLFANEALDELGAEVGNNSLTMRQWLAHTATIVSISLLACALVILVIKIFKLIAGSISDIWG